MLKNKISEIKDRIWVEKMTRETLKPLYQKKERESVEDRLRKMQEDMMWKLHGENAGA